MTCESSQTHPKQSNSKMRSDTLSCLLQGQRRMSDLYKGICIFTVCLRGVLPNDSVKTDEKFQDGTPAVFLCVIFAEGREMITHENLKT